MKKNNKEKNPLISIIVAIYNGEKYLTECIDSILNQNYKNLEIILINDGSTDNSKKIINHYSSIDSRIKVISQKNSGVSTSRNNGLKKATGKYICIIDQDDIISKDYVSYFYNLIKITDAEIAITRRADKFLQNPNKIKQKEKKYEIWSGDKTTEEMLYHKIVIAPWNKMISKDLIEQNKIKFQPQFFGGEGFAFSIDCFQRAKKIVVGNQIVYHYRVGNPESGASKFKPETIESSINAQKYIKENLVNKTDEILTSWKFSNWHTHCDCLNIMVGNGVCRKHKSQYKKLKKICKKDALCAIKAPVSIQQKCRGILFKINPFIASKIFNFLGLRKYK